MNMNTKPAELKTISNLSAETISAKPNCGIEKCRHRNEFGFCNKGNRTCAATKFSINK
jgi:hypothetical protein